jgi:CBS domain-containing protein
LQPLGLLPLLGGCTVAYLVSCLLMRNTIMTEKIARRGVQVPGEYTADLFSQIRVRDVASKNPTVLSAEQSVESVRRLLSSGEPAWSHQGFPVVDGNGILVGVLTRRSVADPALDGSRLVRELLVWPPIIVYDDLTLRDAADHMVNHNIGRLAVVQRENPGKVVGIVTRSDLLMAQRRRLDEMKLHKSIVSRT